MQLAHQKNPHLLRAFLVCALASLFYVYDFFVRVMPAIMTNQLMNKLSIHAGSLGFLASLFLYGYMIMQIPSGLLYDRFGPRRLITIMVLVAAIATYFFFATNHYSIAAIARFFIGFGSAFAYVGCLVLASRWFAPRYFAMIAGLVQFMGCLGAIGGQDQLSLFIDKFGQSTAIMWTAIAGVILAILCALFIRDYPPGSHLEHHFSGRVTEYERLKRVLKKPQNWMVAIFAMACWAPISIFAELWGVQFIQDSYAITTHTAAGYLSILWLSTAFSGPILGYYSNLVGRRNLPMIIASVLAIIGSVLLIFFTLPKFLLLVSLVLIGVGGAAQAVSFGVVQDNNEPEIVGTAVGFNNMAILLGGALFQPIVGLLLEWGWPGDIIAGVHFYPRSDFQHAFIVLPICFFICLIASFFLIEETHCRAHYHEK